MTVNVTLVACASVPLVPVIVRFDVPAGVEKLVDIFSALVPDPVTDVGVKTAVAPVGNTLTEKVTVPLNPFNAVTVLVYAPVAFAWATVWDVGAVTSEKSVTTSVTETV